MTRFLTNCLIFLPVWLAGTGLNAQTLSPDPGGPAPVTWSTPYLKLQVVQDGAFHPVDDHKVHFVYTGEYNAGLLSFKVLDIPRNDRTPALANLQKQYGDNRYTLSLPLLNPGFYTLEVSNEKSEAYFLRFQIR